MDFVLAQPADLDRAMNLVAACIQAMRAQGINQWDEIYPDHAKIDSDIAANSLYFATESGIPRGFVVLDELQPESYSTANWQYPGKILVVHRLAVDPAFHGRGIASQIMAFAESFAQRHAYHAIRLDAYPKNPVAIRLYTRRGYQEAGTIQFRNRDFICFEKQVSS